MRGNVCDLPKDLLLFPKGLRPYSAVVDRQTNRVDLIVKSKTAAHRRGIAQTTNARKSNEIHFQARLQARNTGTQNKKGRPSATP
jgi:hypothetical protein